MVIKPIFGILSAIFTLIGGIPYFLNIHNKKIKPHNLSWLGWAFITSVGGIAMLSDGGVWPVFILFANSLSCIFVVIYSVYKKIGIWSFSKYDFMFFSLGILGLVLWQILDISIIAIICAVVADLFFGIPTIIKTYKDPRSETYLTWLSCSIAGLLSLFSIQKLMISELLYPLYLFIFDTLILFIILIYKKDKK